MKKSVILLPATVLMLVALAVSAQENLQKGAIPSDARKTFTTVKEIPITSVKNQFRSGTCWDYGTLGYFESEILRTHGICPEDAMPAPGSLTGDSLANFKVFFPELTEVVKGIVRPGAKEPLPHWQDSVQAVIERYVGRCPKTFEYEGRTYTPASFAASLGLDFDDYVSLTSYTHHPFNASFFKHSLCIPRSDQM